MAERKREPVETPGASGNKQTWSVSGPGAADLLTAQGGLDRPETDAEKGTGSLRDDAIVTAATGHRLVPDLEAPDNQKERWIATSEDDRKNKPDR